MNKDRSTNNSRLGKNKKEVAMQAVGIKRTLTAMLIALAICIMAPVPLWAAGTIAGTLVTNTVTVNYTVGGANAGTSAQASFTVDTIVRLTVVSQDASWVASAPSATGQLLTFVVTNTSNTVLDFNLASAATTTDPNGGTDTFDANNVVAFFDVNGNSIYDAGTDRLYINELATDTTATVYISADMLPPGTPPTGVADGDIAAYVLSVTAQQSDGAITLGGALTNNGAYNGTTVVFADGLVDGTADATISDAGSYLITAIVVTKTAAVYSDPVNGTGGNRRAIPGAIITYTVAISNPSTVTAATNVSIADSLGALPVTLVTSLTPTPQAFNDGAPDCSISGSDYGIVVDGTCYTSAVDGAVGGITAEYNAGVLSVSGLSLATSATTTIKYQVQVN